MTAPISAYPPRPPAPSATAGARPCGEQDARGQAHHPPGHRAAPLRGQRRDLGGQRHVGHLEAGERAGRQQERQADPDGGESRGVDRHGEHRGEQHRQRDRAGQQQPGAPPRPHGLAVARGADDRVEHHVPRLRHHQHEPGDHGGHTEHVGQVVEQQQSGDGIEHAGADRPDPIPEQPPPPQHTPVHHAAFHRAARLRAVPPRVFLRGGHPSTPGSRSDPATSRCRCARNRASSRGSRSPRRRPSSSRTPPRQNPCVHQTTV